MKNEEKTIVSVRPDLVEKEAQLKKNLSAYTSLAIAYSGGVDSTYLASVAYDVLGSGAKLVLADSPSIPRREVREACLTAEQRHWPLEIIKTQEFTQEKYLQNDSARCYFCKSELFSVMSEYASKHDIKYLAYGAILDDLLDHRPGAKAAQEFSVLAPLQEAGLTKDNIRKLSQQRDLPTWNKASMACLSSRFPRGQSIDIETMARIEQAEDFLYGLGFSQFRVRHHGELCRIEINEDEFFRLFENDLRSQMAMKLKSLGWRWVSMDLEAYRQGSTSG